MISRYALDELSIDGFNAITIGCLLLNGSSTAGPTPQDRYLSDLVLAGNEVDVADTPDYARVIVGSVLAEWDSPDQKARFHCGSPNFGVLTGGDFGGYIFYEDGATDADRKILRGIDGLTPFEFDGVTEFILQVNAAGLYVKENG